MPQIESGYEKASSDNLPCVDSDMIQDFFALNSDFVSAEVRHVKMKKSSKEAYGDNAVSYVQLKKEGSLESATNIPQLGPLDSSVLSDVVKTHEHCSGTIFKSFEDPIDLLSLHQLILKYLHEDTVHSADSFIDYARTLMSDTLCTQAEVRTRGQSQYGRIKAPILYESARCKTQECVLKQKILGALPPLETQPVERGKLLEPSVVQEVSRQRSINIRTASLFMKKEYPIFGASPDGISDEVVIEIKCPAGKKAIPRYVVNYEVQKKFWYQIQAQMFFCNKPKGLFCVASPDFERNKVVDIVNVDFDKDVVLQMLDLGSTFWKNVIYPHVCESNS
nr:unnamed protein product [Callosobruchus analis]